MAANWLIYSLSWTPALRFDLIKIYSENCIMTAPPGVQSESINSIEFAVRCCRCCCCCCCICMQRCRCRIASLNVRQHAPQPHSLPASSPAPDVPPLGSQKQWPKQPPVNLDCGYNATVERGRPWGGSGGRGRREEESGYLQLAKLQSMLNRIFSQASKIS